MRRLAQLGQLLKLGMVCLALAGGSGPALASPEPAAYVTLASGPSAEVAPRPVLAQAAPAPARPWLPASSAPVRTLDAATLPAPPGRLYLAHCALLR